MSGAYDLVVIGGGSGGVAAARRAAGHGARVALVEADAMGGTCVNRGCVPKKLMHSAAALLHEVRHAPHSGILAGGDAGIEALSGATINLAALKAVRDAYVTRLAQVSYPSYLDASGVAVFRGYGRFADAKTVEVIPIDGGGGDAPVLLTAPHILIAVGGAPRRLAMPGGDLTITSDGVFDLAAVPAAVTVIGAGYIAVEMASILAAMGASVTLLARASGPHPILRSFDASLCEAVATEMRRSGITITGGVRAFTSVERRADGRLDVLGLLADDGAPPAPLSPPADVVLQAVGREPSLRGLHLEAAAVAVNAHGHIVVDALQNASVPGIYAVGDACSSGFELTPVAIAAGRLLADRLFGGAAFAHARVSYNARNIPTVVFTQPPLATVGLTEAAAVTAYGADGIKVYKAAFVPMLRAFQPKETVCKTTMKVITAGPEEVVVGLHIHGDGADEMMQGFAVAVQAGLTMPDFNATMAIHPTIAEEIVTLKPWQPRYRLLKD